ncbi:MAG: pitrilysin family protein [Vicinamibacterales bacterium]
MKSTLWQLAFALAVGVQLLVVSQVRAQVQSAWPTSRPPRPLAARDARFPDYEIRTLDNGLQVVVVLHHEQPAVSVRMLVRAGGAQDPDGKAGVAALVGALLDQGTATRSASELAETIDYTGGGMGAGAGTDLSYANVVVMKHDFAQGLDLIADIIRNPTFAQAELDRQREQMLSSLKVSYQDPDYIANTVFDRLVYGFHPYGRPSNGTPESIASITREDLVAFHRTYFAPNNAMLAIVGDVTTDEAFDGAKRVFGDWARKEVPSGTPIEPPAPTRRILVIDRPGAVQTEIRVGHLAIQRKNPDYLAFNLAVRILGGEGANRLHGVLRSERGLTYGAEADLNALKQSGDLVANTDTRSQATAEALRVVVDEFARLQREPVGERELEGAKAYMAGSFPLTIEVPDAIAFQVLNTLFFDLDVKDLQTFRERVMAVGVDEVQRVSQKYLNPTRLSIVLVGDAKSFVPSLKAAGFGEFEVVPLDEIDITTPDFRRRRTPKPAAQP